MDFFSSMAFLIVSPFWESIVLESSSSESRISMSEDKSLAPQSTWRTRCQLNSKRGSELASTSTACCRLLWITLKSTKTKKGARNDEILLDHILVINLDINSPATTFVFETSNWWLKKILQTIKGRENNSLVDCFQNQKCGGFSVFIIHWKWDELIQRERSHPYSRRLEHARPYLQSCPGQTLPSFRGPSEDLNHL